MSSCHYNVTREQIEELIILKNKLDDLTEKIMMSQAIKTCPYNECPRDVAIVIKPKERTQITFTAKEEETIKNFIAEKLGIVGSDMSIGSLIKEDLGADSLDRVELVMAAEERFDISIPDEDAEKLQTVKDVLIYLKSKNVKF